MAKLEGDGDVVNRSMTASGSGDAPVATANLAEEVHSMHIGQSQAGSAAVATTDDDGALKVAAAELGTARPIEGWADQTPAVHLSPDEWNEKLMKLSLEHGKGKLATDMSNKLLGNDAQDLPEDAILLDTRNVYETKVGHFAVPNLPTFFPNTRSASDIRRYMILLTFVA